MVCAPLWENTKNECLLRFQKENIFFRSYFGFLWAEMCQYFGTLKVWLLRSPSSQLHRPEKLILLWKYAQQNWSSERAELCSLRLGGSQLSALKLRPWLCSGFRNHYFILGRTVQNDISCFVF